MDDATRGADRALGGSMQGERYPGERRGLGLFLRELAPVVEARLGTASLLHHAIRHAVRQDTLERLRHARRLFNALPKEVRQELQAGIVGGAETLPRRECLLRGLHAHEPRPFVAFDADALGLRKVELRHELTDDVPIRVLVQPGTLPRSAARTLRDLADAIESDRRLLSQRHWRAARYLPPEEDAEIG
ncbi:MAG: hypothetical protein KDG89_07150 [Geminicoccaceae bacterium]|nr:hypothetical protein [Geminicoccaceae bacterium]